MSKRIKCPYCKSFNISPVGRGRKSFSVGKMALGWILTGGIGLLAGFFGKKGKYEYFCNDCNRQFKHK